MDCSTGLRLVWRAEDRGVSVQENDEQEVSMSKNLSQTYSDDEVLNEISKLNTQTDMMEKLLRLSEARYYESQRCFQVSTQEGRSNSSFSSVKAKLLRFAYRSVKWTLDKLGITMLLKKTAFFKKERVKVMIHKIANGIR